MNMMTVASNFVRKSPFRNMKFQERKNYKTVKIIDFIFSQCWKFFTNILFITLDFFLCTCTINLSNNNVLYSLIYKGFYYYLSLEICAVNLIFIFLFFYPNLGKLREEQDCIFFGSFYGQLGINSDSLEKIIWLRNYLEQVVLWKCL